MTELKRRAAVFAALSDPHRLHIVDLLTLGDLSSTEIQEQLGIRSNLVAHHLDVLERARILTRTRSESDRRRSYIHLLPEAFDSLAAATVPAPERVLFVCTANSARSRIAEAIWRDTTGIPVASAGIRPAASVNPGAVAVANRHGLVIDDRLPRQVDDVATAQDLVITVCDSAHEELSGRDDLHWSIPDPAATGTPEAFERAFRMITQRIRALTARLLPNG